MPIARWLAIALVVGAALVVAPFVPVIVLAIWIGLFARRLHRPLSRGLGGRPNLAAALTVTGIMLLAVPVALLLTSVILDAIALVERVLESPATRTALAQLVSGGDGSERPSLQKLASLAFSQGGRAVSILTEIAGVAAAAVIGLFVLVSGIYAVLVDGDRWYAWIERHAPVAPPTVRRLADAFVETGRGLFIGIGGAGLLQAFVATIAYVVLGVPHALALGLLTLVFSVIPAIGTGIVWVPVAAGLAFAGRTAEAIARVVIGVAVIGMVDNVARPWLASRGQLKLPTYVVLVSMFGGIELFGGWGVLMGPLLVRLAGEVVVIAREQRETTT
jgi:predicted PurR-regulated permease PerM